MRRLLVLPLGEVETQLIEDIGKGLEGIYGIRAILGKPARVPPASYDPERGQYHSPALLRCISMVVREKKDLALGITDEDIFAPGLNFVFGLADAASGAAVISLCRLRQEFYGLRRDDRLFRERALKEAVHEVGHILGLGHCPSPSCVMHFSNSLGDTDAKGTEPCPKCKRRLQEQA